MNSHRSSRASLGRLALLAAIALSAACDPRLREPAHAPAEQQQLRDAAPLAPRPAPATPSSAPSTDAQDVATCPPDPGPIPPLTRSRITIRGDLGMRRIEVEVEVADQAEQRQRGLMYRTELPAEQGMLFVFEEESERSFWMHDTCISLDMIFIADDGTIVSIAESTPTLTDETFSARGPARYVLEMNAGWSLKNGVRAGMQVAIPR